MRFLCGEVYHNRNKTDKIEEPGNSLSGGENSAGNDIKRGVSEKYLPNSL